MSTPQIGSDLPRLLADRYELREQLASGGMASVWRGHDQVLGRDVAIKVLHPHLAADPAFRARFHDEAVNAARLTHPNVVAVFDTGEQGNVSYVVMELVDGWTLEELLREQGPLPPARAARLASDVALALDYAHQVGVVHRNVKPTNILFTQDGTVKVADFSLAGAAITDEPARTGEVLGTVAYLAPEDATGGHVDARVDVYALGACLYQMLTGRPPVPAGEGNGHPSLRSPRAVRPGIPRELDAIVVKAMAPDPADRFPSAQAMASALARSAAGDPEPITDDILPLEAPLPAAQGAPEPSFIRNEGRWLGWTMVVILLAVALGAGGLLLAGRFQDREEGRAPQSTQRHPPSQPLAIQQVDAYDPYGDDGNEKDDRAANAIDGNPESVWSTDGYNDDFQSERALKPGVGLALDVGTARTAGKLELTLGAPGAHVAVYGLDGASMPGVSGGLPKDQRLTDAGWQELVPARQVGRRVTIELPGQGEYRFYLIWFTSLPQDTDGQYRLDVAEAKLVP